MIDESKQRIYSLAERIAKELSELPIFNMKDVTAKIAVHFQFGLADILEGLAAETEDEYNTVKKELTNPNNTGYQIQKIQDKLKKLKPTKAYNNRVMFELKRINEYDALKAFVRNKYGDEAMEEFIEVRDGYIEFLRNNKIEELKKFTDIDKVKFNHIGSG